MKLILSTLTGFVVAFKKSSLQNLVDMSQQNKTCGLYYRQNTIISDATIWNATLGA